MHRFALPVLFLVLTAVGCGNSTDGKFGAELYDFSCSGCHGGRGQGGVLGPALAGEGAPALDLTDEQIFGATRIGPGSMPGNPRLSDDQITSLVAFIRDLQRPSP